MYPLFEVLNNIKSSYKDVLLIPSKSKMFTFKMSKLLPSLLRMKTEI